MANALCEVDRVSVEKDGRRILDIERLAVREGEVLGLLGPNGSGKTTLLRVIDLLEEPISGEVRFAGGAPRSRAEKLAARRRMSMVFQDPMLFNRTVRANVGYGLNARGADSRETARRVDEVLEKVGVAHLADRSARVLSGGEAQRVALARSLVLEPELLLLDEPLASVDAPSREALQTDLHRLLKEDGLTAVYVTHDRSEILALADRVAVMREGRILQVGGPEEVFNRPADEAVASLVGVETVIAGTLVSCEENVASVETGGAGRAVETGGAGGVRIEAVLAQVDVPFGTPVLVAVRPEEVVISKDGSGPSSSARNHFAGTIVSVTDRGYFYRVAVDCGFDVVAHITRPSTREMGLKAGDKVVVSFKATAVHLIVR